MADDYTTRLALAIYLAMASLSIALVWRTSAAAMLPAIGLGLLAVLICPSPL
jgi:hypothetical protein